MNVQSHDAKKEMELSLAAGEIVGKLKKERSRLIQLHDTLNPEIPPFWGGYFILSADAA